MNDKRPAVQEIVRQILSEMGIRKVVSIDDFYATADSHYENAVALFHTARSNQDVEYSNSIPSHILEAEENIWTRQLETFWSEIEPDTRLTILSELAMATEYKELPGDVRDLSLLKGLIPKDLFVALSPDDWDQKRENILSEARSDHRILCLFDQDLRMVNRSKNAGIALLRQTLDTQSDDGCVICGLLTQTLRKIDETKQAREFAAKFGLSLDQFLPLSKDRLRGDLMEFADGLKMTVLNYARERLSKQVRDLTKQASEEAQRQINDIDVYDFEHIVIRSSGRESVWETDTLFRLFNLFHYNAFKRRALDLERREFLYSDIERIRAICSIETVESPQEEPSDKVYRIRHIELFDEADLLNQVHQPINLGDIFEVGSGQYYILLTQPCDLIIRSNGKRSVKLTNLVQIRTLGVNGKEPERISSFQLDYFESRPGQRTFVKFRNSFQIALSVLDLVVFNDDGRCRIFLPKADVTQYPTLHVPWRKRFELLQRHYRKTHGEFKKIPYDEASNYQKEALKCSLICSKKNIDFHYVADGGIFKFDIRRIARLRSPLSVELLSAYFSFLSRNPREHDFARTGNAH